MYVGKPPVRDDGPDVVVTTQAKTKAVVPVAPVTSTTSTTPTAWGPSGHRSDHVTSEQPNIYPQQPTEPPNIYPQQPVSHAEAIDAGHVVRPVVTPANAIIVDAITASNGPTPVQDIGPSILPTPVVNTATGEVVGSVTLDQKTGTPVVTPITADVLYTPQPTDWKPILYAGAAVLGLMFLFGGKKGKK